MDYRFGPSKPKFTGTDKEWNKLKQEIAWWNEETSNYPFVTVICPYCGTKNTHKEDGYDNNRECQLMLDKKCKKYIMIVLVTIYVDISAHQDSFIINIQRSKHLGIFLLTIYYFKI